jgi:hypothetical protein
MFRLPVVNSPFCSVLICPWRQNHWGILLRVLRGQFPMPSSFSVIWRKLKRYFRGSGHNRRCEIPTHSVFCNFIVAVKMFHRVCLPERPTDWRLSVIIILVIIVNFMLGEMFTRAYWAKSLRFAYAELLFYIWATVCNIKAPWNLCHVPRCKTEILLFQTCTVRFGSRLRHQSASNNRKKQRTPRQKLAHIIT